MKSLGEDSYKSWKTAPKVEVLVIDLCSYDQDDCHLKHEKKISFCSSMGTQILTKY